MAIKDLTALLATARLGDAEARRVLWTVVYSELRAMARNQVARHAGRTARQPTSLAHETYLRLARAGNVPGADRREFFAAAARAMHDVQVDEARHRGRLKRGGDRKRVPLDESAAVSNGDPTEALALVAALRRLTQMDSRKSEVVMLRCLGGLTLAETAQALSLSVRTIASEWRFARAWLHRELGKNGTGLR